MDREWVDDQLRMLSRRLGIFRPNPHEFYFEPTEAIYERLASGDEHDLQSVVTAIARHVDVVSIPIASYEWGVKMDLEVAGLIEARHMYRIGIPFFYVGKAYATGAIVAHEITHAFLFSKGIGFPDTQANELLTDVSTIFIGLGKLLLNGLHAPASTPSDERRTLGYLPPDLSVYCFERVRELRTIDTGIAHRFLVSESGGHDHS